MQNWIGLVGIVLILALAVALSNNRRAIRLRVVGPAFALQAGFAVLVVLDGCLGRLAESSGFSAAGERDGLRDTVQRLLAPLD